MIIDLVIILLVISALYRGREIGFVQQVTATIGFFGGLWLGAALEPHTVTLAHSQLGRSFVTLLTTLGLAFALLAAGEYAGAYLKQKLQVRRINRLDNGLGSVVSIVSILAAVWLSAGIVRTLPFPAVQSQLKNSRIVSLLTTNLPAAPPVIADLGHLVDPNGFPQVFTGNEPTPPGSINLPSSSQLAAAVNADRASVVKVEGDGCGGIVEGSGFVVGNNLIATNAHVVAGIRHPYVLDSNGTHTATPIWFDPNLDFAVLRVPNLAGKPLVIANTNVSPNTAAAVMGYPGGGAFAANPAQVLDEFTATGRNIYDQGNTVRDVYEVAASVIPGNSGGPLVNAKGSVIGVIFAESTSYNNVGYALQTSAVVSAINQAAASNTPTSTGSCAD